METLIRLERISSILQIEAQPLYQSVIKKSTKTVLFKKNKNSTSRELILTPTKTIFEHFFHIDSLINFYFNLFHMICQWLFNK